MGKENKNPDVVIIGAGPSGTIAASMLAQAGFSTLVVERSQFPRFVIGESLLPQCMDLLEEADMLSAVQARNYQIKKGAIFRRGDECCQIDFSQQHTKGWTETYQVPRDDFDHTLAKSAQEKGADILFGYEVKAADFSGVKPKVTIRAVDGGDDVEIQSRFVLDASGNAQVLPRLLNTSRPGDLDTRTAIFSQVTPDPGDPEGGREYIVIQTHEQPESIWCWMIPFADKRVSIGMVAKPEELAAYPKDPADCLWALINSDRNSQSRLKGGALMFPPRTLNGYTHSVSQLYSDKYAILGNAGEFLDPIFSSGVTLAFKSANLAVKALIPTLHGEKVDWQAEYADELMHGVNVFRTYVHSWYEGTFQKFLYSDQKRDEYIRMVCSILAGYVWDRSNALVVQHERAVKLMAEICDT